MTAWSASDFKFSPTNDCLKEQKTSNPCHLVRPLMSFNNNFNVFVIRDDFIRTRELKTKKLYTRNRPHITKAVIIVQSHSPYGFHNCCFV